MVLGQSETLWCMAAASLEPDSFGVDYEFEAVEGEGQWMINDTLLRETPGEPLMSYRPAQILHPQGSIPFENILILLFSAYSYLSET